jgi:tyrosinase
MWQAIYPDKWITPTISGGSTWTIQPGDTLDENTPLTPFTMADGVTRYTSKTSRFTKNFGYSYPDVKDWLFTNATKLAANVTARVNQLYNADGTLAPLAVPQTIAGRVVVKRAETRAWTVFVKVPNNATGTAFSVKFASAGTPVGDLVIMAPPSKEEVAAGANKITYGQFALNDALNGIDPTDIASVVSHLKGNLQWQVVNRDGTVVNNVQGLEVQVADQVVTPAQDITEFPVYEEETFHPEITA